MPTVSKHTTDSVNEYPRRHRPVQRPRRLHRELRRHHRNPLTGPDARQPARRSLPMPALGLPVPRADGRPLRATTTTSSSRVRPSTCRPVTSPRPTPDTEFVLFSPTEELRATEAAIVKGMEASGAK